MADEISIDTGGFNPGAMSVALQDLQGQANGFGRSMTTAFKQSVVDGKRFGDVLRGLAMSLSDRALNAALSPISRGIGSAFSAVLQPQGFAKGGVAGGVTPFAAGGVVAAPTYFPMRGGTGLMGEAGAEAIMPLARGADGRLGVRGGGGGGLTVTFNVAAQDAASFRKSEAEITAMLARAVSRGRRGL